MWSWASSKFKGLHQLFFQFNFALQQLLREIPGPLAATCSTMFTRLSLTLSPICCWASSLHLVCRAFLIRNSCLLWLKRKINQNSETKDAKWSVLQGRSLNNESCHIKHLICCYDENIDQNRPSAYQLLTPCYLNFLKSTLSFLACVWQMKNPKTEKFLMNFNTFFKARLHW